MTKNENNKKDILLTAENGVEIPSYASPEASGADLRAFIKSDMILAPGSSMLVPTGLRVAIPSGFEVQVRPRSGLALNWTASSHLNARCIKSFCPSG